MLAVTLCLPGCGRSPSAGAASTAAPVPEPPVVQRLRAEWESHPDRHKGKQEYGEASRALDAEFDREVAAGRSDEIQQYVEQALVGGGETGIAGLLQTKLFFSLVERGERQRLVDLLAAGPGPYSSYWCVEARLTAPVPWNRISDGMMVLFDAYDAGKVEQAKADCYVAVWQALGDAPLKTKDRDAYMRAARAWYAANRDRLVRNERYDHTELELLRLGTTFSTPPRHLYELDPVSR